MKLHNFVTKPSLSAKCVLMEQQTMGNLMLVTELVYLTKKANEILEIMSKDVFCAHKSYFLIPGHISISLSYSLPLFSWHKEALTEFNPSEWLQRYCIVVITTYCTNMKMQTYPKRLNRFIFIAYMVVQHSSNLLYTLNHMQPFRHSKNLPKLFFAVLTLI